MEDVMLAVGRWWLNLIGNLIGWKPKTLRAYEQLQLLSAEPDLIQWPIGEDGTYYPTEPYTVAWYAENATRSMQAIEASKLTALEAINGMRAIYGYEPLPKEPQPEYEQMQFAQADWKAE